MSPRSRRRHTKSAARRTAARRRPRPSIPRQRQAPEDGHPQRAEPFVSNDDALLVLHRAAEDPAFQQFLDQLPLVDLVSRFLEWVGECDDPDDLDGELDPHTDPTEDAPLPSEAALSARLGVAPIGCTAVERWRARVLSMACTRWGLVSLTEEGLERGPDVLGWTAVDPEERAWARALVVAAAVECTARYVSAQHVLGDHVRHALATMLATSVEENPWPLGLLSALRPDDLVSEHVDRVVLEHVTELRAWGLLAEGDELRVAPGAEPLLRSVSVNLRADPVLVPAS
ncbi:hypothetical protein FHN55_02645 [Streptomyces sp. NP160]|uniref:hypothetical protein n=1 Tax=Streptomyces sp. NP160 TaxID=2586637 RepID=UPI001119368A|nr:hypothetical protein [Streptomyces sp. NP160]TNM69665.1 hypothetical protein FHN55_02645 [Streptomyces sp. NP160]